MAVPDKMSDNPEIIIVDKDVETVSCDGGGGPLGHPKVWYSFEGRTCIDCMYCDRRFTKA